MRKTDLDLLRLVAETDGQPRTMGQTRVYAYLTRWRQYQGVGWEEARVYVGEHAEHIPGLASERTAAARRLIADGLVELGESGRRKTVRPVVLTDAGRAFLAGRPESA